MLLACIFSMSKTFLLSVSLFVIKMLDLFLLKSLIHKCVFFSFNRRHWTAYCLHISRWSQRQDNRVRWKVETRRAILSSNPATETIVWTVAKCLRLATNFCKGESKNDRIAATCSKKSVLTCDFKECYLFYESCFTIDIWLCSCFDCLINLICSWSLRLEIIYFVE